MWYIQKRYVYNYPIVLNKVAHSELQDPLESEVFLLGGQTHLIWLPENIQCFTHWSAWLISRLLLRPTDIWNWKDKAQHHHLKGQQHLEQSY